MTYQEFRERHEKWLENKYADPFTGHYKCQRCGFWSTYPMDNHNCMKFTEKKNEQEITF